MSTKQPMLIQCQEAQKIINAIFKGAQLDSFEVRNIEIVMTMMNSDSSGILHQFRVTSLNSIDSTSGGERYFGTDFQIKRKNLLPELYGLLGSYVSSAMLDDVQRLIITFVNDSSLIFSNDMELEFDPLDFNWHIDFDDDWECAPVIQSLSCVVSETRKPNFYIRSE